MGWGSQFHEQALSSRTSLLDVPSDELRHGLVQHQDARGALSQMLRCREFVEVEFERVMAEVFPV